MNEALLPEDEAVRLEALKEYDVLDTLPEQAYDDITYLASQICDTPIAVVSLVDEDRQWFKSRRGLDVSETPRDIAFCAHAILNPDTLLIVEDASKDGRFSDNPMVTSDPPIRFYAGAPLVTSTGHALGTLCVIDRKPRQLSPEQQDTLRALSRQVIAQLELRRTAAELQVQTEVLNRSHAVLEQRNDQLRKSRDELAELVELLKGQADVIERDLHRAEVIQRSLLPHEVPKLADFNIKTLYRPGHTIGGDLYDVVSIADRYLALVVADASGHGVSAAMLSVLFKHHMRVQDQATHIPYQPGWALARINASLLANRPVPGVFITAIYCLLDTQERRLVIGSAGHTPLLHLRADGGMETLRHTGPALGLEEGAVYEEHELILGEGDRVLLYTDGLLDICETLPSIETIAETLRGLGDDPEALEHLLQAVTQGQIRQDCDDVTLLLLNASAGESVFNESVDTLALTPLPAGELPVISYADTATATILIVEGRVTWFYGQTVFDTGMAAIDAGRDLVIDLGGCEHLDSTLLGTLHELTVQALEAGRSCLIQNAAAALRSNFEELSMTVVLEHIARQPLALPEERTQLDLSGTQVDRQQQRLLKAHEVLAELSDENQEQFGSLLETLRSELESGS
jgi:serine phosphatase RsbU (regulator of sigma subunit)/anti-anti-sigma regulatory factor